MGEPDIEEPKAKMARHDHISVVPVLPTEVASECVGLVDCFALKITDSKRISSVLSVLAQRMPLPTGLAHLKRVKADGTVLLRPTSVGSIADDILEELCASSDDVIVVSVAATKPWTRRQYMWAKERWPTGFHADKKLEATLDGTYFDAQQRTRIGEHMETAMRAAKRASVGCVIARRDGALVAVAHDSMSDDRPLAHAVLNAVELVARSQGGGSSFVVTEQTADFRFDASKGRETSKEYLCTDWDCFVTDEPCAMCAMALLHSRIGRVFYLHDSPSTGALGSKFLLHSEKSLNHQFHVFRVHLN